MAGKKAQYVRKSLKYLLKVLNEEDRICIICFGSDSKILTPFLKNNADNKSKLKEAIKYVKGRSSTNIALGINDALWMLKNR